MATVAHGFLSASLDLSLRAARSSCARSTSSASASSRALAGNVPFATSASISRRWPRSTSRLASCALGPVIGRARSNGTSTIAKASAVISEARTQKTAIGG